MGRPRHVEGSGVRLMVETKQLDDVTDLWAQLTASLEQIGEQPAAGGKATTIADEIGDEGMRRQKKMIELGRRLDTGEKFQPPDLLYRERKAKAGGGSQLLVWTRALYNSAGYEKDGNAITIGFSDPKAAYHFSQDARSKIPLRDAVTLPDSFYDWAEERVAEGAVYIFERRLGAQTS